MSKEFFKGLVGKEVFAIPTGNNVNRYKRHNGEKEVVKLLVEKMARVNITVSTVGEYTREFVCKVEDWSSRNYINCGCNAGYLLFETEQQLNDYYAMQLVNKKFNSYFTLTDPVKAIKIAEIMEWDDVLAERYLPSES